MKLKKKLNTLEGLDAALHQYYHKEEDGTYTLQVEGDTGGEDLGALKRAKDHEKNLRVAAESRATTAEEQLASMTTERDAAVAERDAARADKGKDVSAIETSWQEKLNTTVTAKDGEITALSGEVNRLLVTNEAFRLASEISTVPDLFSGVIASRLKAEKGADGKYFTRILDAAGNPSALTLDELKQELLANEKYAAIIVAGKGSGGGAGGSGSGGGAGEKKFLDYSDKELSDMQQNDPEQYKRLRDAYTSGAN